MKRKRKEPHLEKKERERIDTYERKRERRKQAWERD